jgi:hypothetical protein
VLGKRPEKISDMPMLKPLSFSSQSIRDPTTKQASKADWYYMSRGSVDALVVFHKPEGP